MKIAASLAELIGNTPLVALGHLAPEADVVVKLECFNPLSSAKDRAAKGMLDAAEAAGLLRSGGIIVEPTSGNTGVGLAYQAALRGYTAVFTMPASMSVERRMLLTALGAELVLTEPKLGMQGAVDKAKELAAEYAGAFLPDQFNNEANARAHYETTGPEIWRDTDGTVDVFVACVGTGGTVTGVGRYLKEQNQAVEIVAVEPAESPLLSEGKAGPHKIQGIGANFVPGVLDRGVIDRVVTVTGETAFATARLLAKTEGILTGISSGAAVAAALKLAAEPAYQGKRIVALLPDTGERYLSSGVFETPET